MEATAPTDEDKAASAFIARWKGVQLTDATELATSQTFVLELCALLGVPTPLPSGAKDYEFERPITFSHGDGSSSAGRIDCYRRSHFVWESKKLRYIKTETRRFDAAMLTARAQAESYARALPAAEGRPPFLLVVDVGNVFELYAEFTRSGATYTPFPDPRSHRLLLADLAKPAVRQRLALVWTDPEALNPARTSARVTREVAAQLADLAKSLEQSGHRADHVAAFLTRCLFSMFAEDVELLPKGSFLRLLEAHREQPATAQQMLRVLWTDMDHGGFSAALATPVLHFNGKLFKEPLADGYSLLLNKQQLDQLIAAAKANWREVEPAIFGTLLERALDPTERHALGAHYTPRAYVERLVLPTVVEPLRADWANAQAAAVLLALEAEGLSGKAFETKIEEARAEVRRFHHQLCTTRVLDPACGSGNFLYVTLEHLKRLEGEVINQLESFGQTQDSLGLEGETVSLQQLRGIELNERGAALAELVLWIGYLQWHIRTRGNKAVAEPVVHDYGNIECRDAVLAWDDIDLARDAQGQTLMRWDGKTFKTHPVTGAQVPDEMAQVPQWRYIRPRKAVWPRVDFIVGNPPFIGASTMRATLGDGYVEALRKTWADVPESADFVMYWWHQAAQAVGSGHARRFGFITTNSLRQTFNRRVVQAALGVPVLGQAAASGGGGAGAVSLVFAIPDHPWVDSANGAAVRIAMTVCGPAPLRADFNAAPAEANPVRAALIEASPGRLLSVIAEQSAEEGEVAVTLSERWGEVHADLSLGADVASAVTLEANSNISSPGVKLHGAGFIVTQAQAIALGLGQVAGLERHIRDYRNGRDLTDAPRGVTVIDLFGLSAEQVRRQFPEVYQWLLERVKPERDQNNRATYRDNWWLFGEPRKELRPVLQGLPRYIATVETSKYRNFQFLEARILPDNMLIAIGSAEAFHLGTLSSRAHIVWSLATGGRLGVGNDPRYNKSRCFETFPFPDNDTGLTPELRAHIGTLAEQIDAHRKRVLQPELAGSAAEVGGFTRPLAQPAPATANAPAKGMTLTGLYNVLEALKEGRPLTPREKAIHDQGLVGVLKSLHDELDAAVLDAYGWSDLQGNPDTDALLQRLVALNTRRAAQEKQACIRWLRPEFQNPGSLALKSGDHEPLATPRQQANLALEAVSEAGTEVSKISPWPNTLPEQVRAVASVLSTTTAPLAVADIEARFKGRGAWKKSLPRILETLEALGRARKEQDGKGALWRA